MALLILTLAVITILLIDGVITSLPFFNLKSQRSDATLLFFGIEVAVVCISQIFFLRIIGIELKRSSYTAAFLKSASIIHYIIFTLQCFIIFLLFFILMQLVFYNEYNTLYLRIVILVSIILSVGLLALLAIRFVQWIRHRPDYLTGLYAVATALMAVTSLFLAVFMGVEMANSPGVITSSRLSITDSHVGNFELQNLQSNIGLIAYIVFWLASVALLRKSIKNPKKIGFYFLVTIPLLYSLGIFQWIISSVLAGSELLNALQIYTFNVISSILTKPVGGAILGVAFLIVSRRIDDRGIKNYMKLSAIGIILLAISNEDARIYLLPYPPFGIVTISFIGISSYLLMVGIYYAAVSTSINNQIRAMIERSVDKELTFLSNIARSQMEMQIMDKVKTLTKKFAEELTKDSGVGITLQSRQIEEQISFVLKERDILSQKKNNNTK
jgi:hypothetical protein